MCGFWEQIHFGGMPVFERRGRTFLAAALGKEKWEAVRNAEELDEQIDFCHIRGQEIVKRAAEVAVSGGHNLLLALYPPGAGSP